jgi:hypothetical protein
MALWFLTVCGAREALHVPRAEALNLLGIARLRNPKGDCTLQAADGTIIEPSDPPPFEGKPLTASFLSLLRKDRHGARKGV